MFLFSIFIQIVVNNRCSGLEGKPPRNVVVFARRQLKNNFMSDHIYKKIELVGSSPNGIEEAVKNALARAQKTMRNMRWFEVAETRGYLEEGNIAHWQGTLKGGFTLDGLELFFFFLRPFVHFRR